MTVGPYGVYRTVEDVSYLDVAGVVGYSVCVKMARGVVSFLQMHRVMLAITYHFVRLAGKRDSRWGWATSLVRPRGRLAWRYLSGLMSCRACDELQVHFACYAHDGRNVPVTE